MALEYFLYRTDFNNTLVDRSNNSFAPLPPDTSEILIDFFIPDIQPLYLYRESGGNIIYNDEKTVNEYVKEISPLPTSEDSVLQYQFTGYTASTDTKIDNLVSSLSGTSTGQTITTIDFHSNASASVTLTNQALAEQFFGNNNRVIKRVNLSNALQLRLITRVVTGSISINNPRLILKYKTGAFSTVVGDYINAGITEIATSLTSAGISESSWIDIAPLAKGDVYLTITQIGGDAAADPVVGNTFVEIKNLVKTADVILSGITEQVFTGYTASTNQQLIGIESDINYISGVTNTKHNIVDFNSYTGVTDTRLENIENNIDYISGQTDSKLATTAFNTFTGTTAPARFVDVSGDTMTGNLLFSGTVNSVIGRSTNDGAISLFGGTSEPSGAYFQITGSGYTASPYGGSAEFVIRNLAQSQFTLFSYDGISTWTPRFSVAGQTGLVTINNNLTINGTTILGNITPDVNQQNFTVIDNITKKVANSGTKFHVYGTEFQYVQDLTTTTTIVTTPTYATKLTMTTGTLPIGTYRITGSFGMNKNVTNSDLLNRIQVDGTNLGGIYNVELRDGTTWDYGTRVMFITFATATTHTITLQFSQEAAGTLRMRDASLEIIRVS